MSQHLAASDLAKKALSDNTKYDAREIAHAWTDDIYPQLQEAIANYRDKIDQDEFCVVMVIATDPLLVNLKRRKFYCWPYLPSPRPNQSVFLYNKRLDIITKRLWVLPHPDAMAVLATPGFAVQKEYVNMKRWSMSFFEGSFWDDIRKEHGIKMLSQEEFDALNREKLVEAGLESRNPSAPEPFDFSKICTLDVGDPNITPALQDT